MIEKLLNLVLRPRVPLNGPTESMTLANDIVFQNYILLKFMNFDVNFKNWFRMVGVTPKEPPRDLRKF